MKFGGTKLKGAMMLAVAGLIVGGCSTGSAILDSVSSAGDRFTQLFGGKSQAAGESANAGQNPDDLDLYCPDVAIRDNTATLTSVVTGSSGVGATRYQGTITRTARECVLSGGTTMNVKVGIQGRIIAGPAGAPPTVDVPIRVAVVQEGVPPKLIFSRFYKTSVAMTESNTPFSFVAEDISYPAPSAQAHSTYIFYLGFDPEGARQPPPRASKKGR